MSTKVAHIPSFEFLSRPDIHAPKLLIHNLDESKVAPGFIFLTPGFFGSSNIDRGPAIYDNSGDLIWWGYEVISQDYSSTNLQVCTYLGAPHLCYSTLNYDALDHGSLATNMVLNDHYQTADRFSVRGRFESENFRADPHEFRVSGNPGKESFISIVHVMYRRISTIPQCGPDHEAVEFVKPYIFVDRWQGNEFVWNSIDHVDPSETVVCPGQNSVTRNGHQHMDAFDYFHMNSVEKDPNGDYIISARHTSTIYKIAGADSDNPGSVMWRLGGPKSDFAIHSAVPGMTGEFKYQHHARIDGSILGANKSGMLGLSIWDNANSELDFGDASEPFSSGKTYLLNMSDHTATLVGAYYSPDKQLNFRTGSHQVLSNGNHFLGYGDLGYVAELDGDNNPVFYATLGNGKVESYRAFRYEWEGHAPDPPSLFGFSHNCSAPATFYVSMNGETGVAFYKFYTSSLETRDYSFALEANKTGFETVATAVYNTWAFVEAFDASGNMLGQSKPSRIFVPSFEYSSTCDENKCDHNFDYTNAPTTSCPASSQSATSIRPSIPLIEQERPVNATYEVLDEYLPMLTILCAILVFLLSLYGIVYIHQHFLSRIWPGREAEPSGGDEEKQSPGSIFSWRHKKYEAVAASQDDLPLSDCSS